MVAQARGNATDRLARAGLSRPRSRKPACIASMASRSADRPSAKGSGDTPYCHALGDIVLVTFGPRVGTGQGVTRPGLVLTPRACNSRVGRPITGRGH